jgi:hypothetical protein
MSDAATPIGPDEAPPPARPKSLWEIYGPRRPLRLLLFALGGMVVICGAMIALTPRLGGNLTQGAGPCGWSLGQVGKALVGATVHRGAYPEDADARYLIELLRDGYIARRKESYLVCGWDPDALRIESDSDRELFHTADLSDPEMVTQLCSYAIRDFARFPVDLDDDEAWLLCERMGADGRTRFLRREDLEIAPEDPIVVGPDSPHPELRKMVFLRER